MKSQQKVLLIFPRGEAIRNFIYSGCVEELRKNAYVVIISVIPNVEIETLLRQNCDELYELKETHIPYFIGYLWDFLDIAHGKWLWSKAAEWRWKLRDIEAKTFSKKIKRIAKKIFVFPFANRLGVEFLASIESFCCQKISPDKYYLSLLKKIKPDLVFNGSHIHGLIARPIIHAAKALGIKTATFLFSWDNLTSQGRIFPYYNYYLVWNDNIKEELLRIYGKIKRETVFVSGTPQFDFHFQKDNIWSKDKYLNFVGAEEGRPIIMYSTGMARPTPGEDLIVRRIGDICKTIESRPQLIVRVYPKDLTGRFDTLKKERKDILFPKIDWEINYLTPMPEDIALYTNMLLYCEAGINVASTVSLELCMFDKPVINIGYNPIGMDVKPVNYASYYQWDHYKPLTDSGAISIAWSEEEMKGLITQAIKHPELKSEMRQKLIKDFFGDLLDGKSYIRIAEALIDITSKLS